MKSSVLLTLAVFLATAILAPAVMTLTNIDDSVMMIDFNEEEKKEEKQEAKEKDFFLDSNLSSLANRKENKTSAFKFYLESDYSTTLSILLPPPKFVS